MISEAEKAERREEVASAIGTHRAEGIEMPAAALQVMQRYADGELTLAEFSVEMDAAAARTFTPQRELTAA